MMLASASMPIADRDLGDPYGYVFKQSFAIVLGLLFGLIIFSIIFVFVIGYYFIQFNMETEKSEY